MKKHENKPSKKLKLAMIMTAILMVVIVASTLTFLATQKQPTTENETIKIPLNQLSTTAQFFEEEIDGVTVKYFAIKDQDGNIKTAFDACDVCYNSKKGYTQDGDYMVCNNCGNRYHVSGLGTENKAKGGCWPSYLQSSTDGDNLIIQKNILRDEKRKFT